MKRSRYTSPRVGSYSQSSLESLWKLRRRCEPAEPEEVVGLRRRGIVIRGAAAAYCFLGLCTSARGAARVLLLVKQWLSCRARVRQRFRESVARLSMATFTKDQLDVSIASERCARGLLGCESTATWFAERLALVPNSSRIWDGAVFPPRKRLEKRQKEDWPC